MRHTERDARSRAGQSGPSQTSESFSAGDRPGVGPEGLDEVARFRNEVRRQLTSAQASVVLHALDFLLADVPNPAANVVQLARLLMDQHADHVSLAAMLLARVSPGLSSTNMEAQYGEEIAGLVCDLQGAAPASKPADRKDAPDLQRFIQSVARDARYVLLRVADRIVVLERGPIDGQSPAALRELAREALDVHVVLADRVGLGQLRRRLEDIAFRILEPTLYDELAEAMAPIREQDRLCLPILERAVVRLLARNAVAAEVAGRTKGLYSLYRKMLRTRQTLEQITDRIGLRVIVDSVPTCYQVLGLLHSHFCPIPGTFDDYIGRPKENGYQSLHTCVYPLRDMSDKAVEFQIRTCLMHANCEFGAAAHWRYKRLGDVELSRRAQLRWLRDLASRCQSMTSPEFVAELRRRAFEDHIVIFREGGAQQWLPVGSTVGDFRQQTIPPRPRGTDVYVNGMLVADEHLLRDGDSVQTPGLEPEAGSAEGVVLRP